MKNMKLQYLGVSDFPEYPLYKDETGRLWVNIEYRLGDRTALYSLSGNSPEGEPMYPWSQYHPDADVTFVGEPDQRMENYKFEYALLGRLQSDCEYFLGYGNACVQHLYAPTIQEHIEKMKELWNTFPDDLKPEWLSMADIEAYGSKMQEAAKRKQKGA